MLYQNLTVRPVLFGVAGDKNTGKTTLMEELIRRLTNRGWKVAAIKHDGHDFEADREGTDSWRHYHAGAYGTVVFSNRKYQLCQGRKGYFPGEAHSPFSGSGCDSDRGNETGIP